MLGAKKAIVSKIRRILRAGLDTACHWPTVPPIAKCPEIRRDLWLLPRIDMPTLRYMRTTGPRRRPHCGWSKHNAKENRQCGVTKAMRPLHRHAVADMGHESYLRFPAAKNAPNKNYIALTSAHTHLRIRQACARAKTPRQLEIRWEGRGRPPELRHPGDEVTTKRGLCSDRGWQLSVA